MQATRVIQDFLVVMLKITEKWKGEVNLGNIFYLTGYIQIFLYVIKVIEIFYFFS